MDPKNTATPPAPIDNRLTVLVFKDGFASRTFQIPLGWFSRIGLAVGFLAALSVFLTLFAIKAYYAAHRSSPARVETLEGELSDLRASNRLLESKLSEKPSEPSTAPMAAAAPAPAPTVTVTVTPVAATPAAAAPAAGHPAKALLFSALPPETQGPPASAASIPIQIHSPRANIKGGNLDVRFDLQYERQDHGNQQGRIVILARGPQTILGYPEGVLNSSTHDILLSPEHGEYFSVSRFRAVKAEFQPVTPDSIKEVEVLLFDANQNLIIHTRIEPTHSTAKAEPEETEHDAEPNQQPSDEQPENAEPATPATPPAVQQAQPPSAPAEPQVKEAPSR